MAIGSPEGCVQRASEVWYNTHASQRHCGVFSLIEPRIYCVQETSFLECVDCAAGQYSAAAGASVCTDCEVGRYQASGGQSSCTECEAGKFNGQTRQSSESVCTNCGVGQYSATGSASCTSCEAGRYSPSSTQAGASCTDCPVGTYQDETGRALVVFGYEEVPYNSGAYVGNEFTRNNAIHGVDNANECFSTCKAHRDAPQDCRYFKVAPYFSSNLCFMYTTGTNQWLASSNTQTGYIMTSTDPNFRDSCKNCPSGKTSPSGSDSLADCVNRL